MNCGDTKEEEKNRVRQNENWTRVMIQLYLFSEATERHRLMLSRRENPVCPHGHAVIHLAWTMDISAHILTSRGEWRG